MTPLELLTWKGFHRRSWSSTTPIWCRQTHHFAAPQVDSPGVRVAVVEAHASTLTLRRVGKQATLVSANTPESAFELLRAGQQAITRSGWRGLWAPPAARAPGSRWP